MLRRAIVLSFLASFAAGAAYAQVSSEPLAPPPGDNGDYDAPPAGDGQGYGPPPQGGYGAQGQGAQDYGTPAAPADADPADNPYADPSAGGTYDPNAARQSPRQYAPPAGAQGYGAPAPSGSTTYSTPYSAQPYRSTPPGAAPYGSAAAPQGGPTPLVGPNAAGSPGPARSMPPQAAPAGPDAMVGSSCGQLAAELDRFRGPPDNPMKPRDEACAAARAGGEPGRPNQAFRQCSDAFFQQYERKRDEYRACMDQEAGSGRQRLEQRETTVEAARSGYAGTAPQPTGRFARSGAPGWLGIQVQPVSPQDAYRLGAEGVDGALVIGSVMGSPAQKAGVQRGDIIVGFDGEAISQPKDLQYHAERLSAGQTVKLEIIRAGQRQVIPVQVTQRP